MDTMNNKNPYDIVKRRYITEKATMLEKLKESKSNKCIARCESPKYVFLVDPKANKKEIAQAIETIYSDKGVTVVAVNTINMKSKKYNRRGRMQGGKDNAFKKAIVTFAAGNGIEE